MDSSKWLNIYKYNYIHVTLFSKLINSGQKVTRLVKRLEIRLGLCMEHCT